MRSTWKMFCSEDTYPASPSTIHGIWSFGDTSCIRHNSFPPPSYEYISLGFLLNIHFQSLTLTRDRNSSSSSRITIYRTFAKNKINALKLHPKVIFANFPLTHSLHPSPLDLPLHIIWAIISLPNPVRNIPIIIPILLSLLSLPQHPFWQCRNLIMILWPIRNYRLYPFHSLFEYISINSPSFQW